MVWNILILLFLFYGVIFLPFSLAFLDENNPNDSRILAITEYIDYASTFLFGTDILVMFLSAIPVENNPPETRLDKIAVEYVKSYFFVDVLSTFPFDMVIEYNGGRSLKENKLLRLARIPRIYRIMKLFKLVKMIKLLKYNSWG
jgi:hypothetical protein